MEKEINHLVRNLLILVGDLHLGNLYSDIPAFLKMVFDGVKNFRPKETWVIMVGDVIEGNNKYRTQIYKIFNVEPIRVQILLLKRIIEDLKVICQKFNSDLKLRIILGNHDLGYDYGNIIDLLDYKVDIKTYYDLYILKYNGIKIVFKHELVRGSRGSYITGWTGYLLNEANKILNDTGGNIIVTAHTHQPMISWITRDGRDYIMLPSFLNEKKDHEWNYLLFFHDFGSSKLKMKKTPWTTLESQNRILMDSILKGRHIRGEENIL